MDHLCSEGEVVNIIMLNKYQLDAVTFSVRNSYWTLLRTVLCTITYYCTLLRTIAHYCILLHTIVYYCRMSSTKPPLPRLLRACRTGKGTLELRTSRVELPVMDEWSFPLFTRLLLPCLVGALTVRIKYLTDHMKKNRKVNQMGNLFSQHLPTTGSVCKYTSMTSCDTSVDLVSVPACLAT